MSCRKAKNENQILMIYLLRINCLFSFSLSIYIYMRVCVYVCMYIYLSFHTYSYKDLTSSIIQDYRKKFFQVNESHASLF